MYKKHITITLLFEIEAYPLNTKH
jgi:hypothetical protein